MRTSSEALNHVDGFLGEVLKAAGAPLAGDDPEVSPELIGRIVNLCPRLDAEPKEVAKKLCTADSFIFAHEKVPDHSLCLESLLSSNLFSRG